MYPEPHQSTLKSDAPAWHCRQSTGVGSKQFLLRGSQLRNTPWIWGVVVYTGAETKVMKNSRDAPSKLSILEQTMNQCILLVLATQFIVCAFGAGFFCIWTDSNSIFNTQFR